VRALRGLRAGPIRGGHRQDGRRRTLGPALAGRLDRLTDALVDPLPGAVPPPPPVPGVDRAPGREIVRQQPPPATGAEQVQDGVQDRPPVGRRPARPLRLGQVRRDQGELLIGQVGSVPWRFQEPLYGSGRSSRTAS
jgi:hypothetical protein